jgi:hypothetical protein
MPSRDRRSRSRGRSAAPATAPSPRQASRPPKPAEPSPCRRATSGSNAQAALPKTVNNAVRTSTARNTGAWRM